MKDKGGRDSQLVFRQQNLQVVATLPPGNRSSELKSKTDRALTNKRQSKSNLDKSSLDPKRESGTTSRSPAVPLKTAELLTSLHGSQ